MKLKFFYDRDSEGLPDKNRADDTVFFFMKITLPVNLYVFYLIICRFLYLAVAFIVDIYYSQVYNFIYAKGTAVIQISVIIPVYNGERFIGECLESVRRCPSDDMECIIINDGSTDGTETICRRFAETDRRFNVINKTNAGVSDSRNIGMDFATGRYVFFLDADDYMADGAWPGICARAAENAHDMVAYGYYNLFASGAVTGEDFPSDCGIERALFGTTLLNTCWGVLLRRSIIIDNALRFRDDLKTCEDAVFMIDFAGRADTFLFCNEKILYYRIHTGGVMRRSSLSDKLTDFAVLLARRIEYANNYGGAYTTGGVYLQAFSVVTDLLRECAGNNGVRDARRAYAETIGGPIIINVLMNTDIKKLPQFHKKFEFLLVSRGPYLCAAVYFKLKYFKVKR